MLVYNKGVITYERFCWFFLTNLLSAGFEAVWNGGVRQGDTEFSDNML